MSCHSPLPLGQMQDMAADRIPPMLQPSVHSIIDGYVDKFRDNTLQQVRGMPDRSAS